VWRTANFDRTIESREKNNQSTKHLAQLIMSWKTVMLHMLHYNNVLSVVAG